MCPDEVEAVVEPPPLELGEPQLLLAAAAGRVHQLYQGPSDVEGEERGGGGLAGEEDGRAAVAWVGADLRAGEVDLAAHCSTDRRPLGDHARIWLPCRASSSRLTAALGLCGEVE